jgi:hypothetical protein
MALNLVTLLSNGCILSEIHKYVQSL